MTRDQTNCLRQILAWARAEMLAEIDRLKALLLAPKPSGVLDREIAHYNRLLPHMLALGHEGKYVLIFRESVVDYFDSPHDALRAGYEKTLSESFLVRQVLKEQPVWRV